MGVKSIVAVASGKGGVGKSTTAVNIAFALARAGQKVGLLDADVYGPSIPRMVKVTKPAGQSQGPGGTMMTPPEADGVKVLSAGMFLEQGDAATLRGPRAGGVVKQFLTQIDWGELDVLLIDYPPGTGDIQLTISQTAPLSGALVVTTPQEVALLDVRRAVAMFKTLKVPVLGVIETMSSFICDGCDKVHHIFREGGGERLARELGVSFLGGIPLDPRVVVGGDEGRPQVVEFPDSPVAKAYASAAQASSAQLERLRNVQTTIGIKDIQNADERTLAITWTDGKTDRLDAVALRRRCPCAACIDEWTGEKRLKPEDVADTVRVLRVEPNGAYALRIGFTDGHGTGIYTYGLLKQIASNRQA